MKSTLPVREWAGMRPPPDSGMVGFNARYSKTRAPELSPLTICGMVERDFKNNAFTSEKNVPFSNLKEAITLPIT